MLLLSGCTHGCCTFPQPWFDSGAFNTPFSLVAKVNLAPPSKWLGASETSHLRALNQALLRASLSARVVMDEAGTIVECNNALCELTHYAESEPIGVEMVSLFILSDTEPRMSPEWRITYARVKVGH